MLNEGAMFQRMMKGLLIIALLTMVTVCYAQTNKPTIIKVSEFTIEFVDFSS